MGPSTGRSLIVLVSGSTEILEEWIVLKLRDRDLLPVVDGIDLNLRAA
jgi:hypothetical protein